MPTDEQFAILSAKVVLLEYAVRTLMKEKYLQTDDPVGEAEHAAEELKTFFNPRRDETVAVLRLQHAVDGFYDVLAADLETELGIHDKNQRT